MLKLQLNKAAHRAAENERASKEELMQRKEQRGETRHWILGLSLHSSVHLSHLYSGN